METKEKNRRRAPGTARRKTGGTNRRTTTGKRTGEAEKARRVAARRREASAAAAVRTPREDIPEVTYTMPKPFRRGAFVLRLASVAAAVGAVILCLSLFFRVEDVVVSGTQKYTPWMIKEASGVEYGDSLLSIRDARVSGRIISQLPYVKQARVGIKLPGTVHIEIEELEVAYAIQARDGGWWLIAADGRVIEQIETTAAAKYTRIFGVQADAPRTDQKVLAVEHTPVQTEPPTEPTEGDGVTLPIVAQVTAAQRLDVVLVILQQLEENGVIGEIATIDVSNLNDITMEYGTRLRVVLGTEENLPYKIRYMAQAIAQIEDYQTGELDVSFKYSDKALVNPE